jgi:phage baseplate assembly protein gpV
LGVVTAVDDPQKIGRVRVSLPAYGGVESDWLGMTSIGGGAGKGLMMLPDVGDQVLVLLMHGEPGEAIILGGLYGTTGPPDSGVEGGSVRRYTLQTSGGQRLRFDDGGGIVRFENRDGSFVELAPGKMRIFSAADLELDASGKAVVIRGRSIDFQRG